MKLLTPSIIALVLLTGCSPEVGSKGLVRKHGKQGKRRLDG